MARKTKPSDRGSRRQPHDGTGGEHDLRIVGGTFRGRKLQYHGDPVVRPMKHRVRESIFNLISTEAADRHAVDLFAGTGALGLEAISRGSAGALFIEKHVPSARVVEQNIATLEVEHQCSLRVTSAFLWGRRDLPQFVNDVSLPWLVFCSPPYAFWVEREADMLDLVRRLLDQAPADSIFVVEADERFDFQLLPGAWDVRTYAPAVIGVFRG